VFGQNRLKFDGGFSNTTADLAYRP